MRVFVVALALFVPLIVSQTKNDGDDVIPEQIHISFGDKVNDITITWSTMSVTPETVVIFGEETPDTEVTGDSYVFVDGGPRKRCQKIHIVALKDLKYDTSYVYKVGSKLGWSEQYSFTTPPAGEDFTLNAIIYGDLGVDNDQSSENVYEDIKSNRFHLVIHNGDLAYDMGTYNGQMGDRFMNMVQKIAANVPYMTSPGNHEGGYNFSNYKNRFSMPGNTKNMYYSYDVGPVHFVVLNTEAYYGWKANPRHPKDEDEIETYDDEESDVENSHHPATKEEVLSFYNWFKADLEEANKKENRDKHPWIIVYGHRPMYCSSRSCRKWSDINVDMKYPHRVGISAFGGLGLELLLKDYGVDLALWAHEHQYERTFPLYNETVYNGSYDKPYVNPRAPVHITSGAAGNDEGETEFVAHPKEWSAFRSDDYGYLRLKVYNHTHLYMESVSTQDYDGKEKYPLSEENKARKIDEMWLIKDSHKPYDI